MLKIGHEVVRPGKRAGDPPINIPVPEELETLPGIPTNQREVDWYAREYPLEQMHIVERAALGWSRSVRDIHGEMREIRKEHVSINKKQVLVCRSTDDQEPSVPPGGEDVTQLIKEKARELGYLEVGITAYDHRYSYVSLKDWVKFPHAVCLAYEQDYGTTQTIPSIPAEVVHVSAYRNQNAAGLDLGNFIRSLGYHAQVIHSSDDPGAYLPMFVNAGLGQLGACGYLLTPHEGNRCRLMMIPTDAKVSYDQPVDYGMHAFCQVCQICVNRCPGRALMRDKIWWRGIEKNKVYFRRCRPVMARYHGCAVCMKTCPMQKYGMKNVMDHYAATGQVLGKGTHDLEGYSLPGKGYFGPGQMPVFEPDFFNVMPRGTNEEWAFDQFKARAKAQGGVITNEILAEFRKEITSALTLNPDDAITMMT